MNYLWVVKESHQKELKNDMHNSCSQKTRDDSLITMQWHWIYGAGSYFLRLALLKAFHGWTLLYLILFLSFY